MIDKKGTVTREATTIHVLVALDLDTNERAVYKGDTLLDGVRRLWAADEIHGHNVIGYDIPVIERVTGLKRPPGQAVNDTLIRSRLIWPERQAVPMGGHSLEAWGQWLKVRKGEFKGPWDSWSQEMEDYCIQDVRVNRAILMKLDTIPQNEIVVRIEHEVAKIIARQTANGWTFNRDGAERLIAELEIERAGITDELASIFPPRIETMKQVQYWMDPQTDARYPRKGDAKGAVAKRLQPGPLRTKEHPFNPDSGKQIAERFTEKYGWKPAEFTDIGEPKTDYDVLVKLPYPEAAMLLKYSDNAKLLEQVIDRFKRASLNRDGKMHGSLNVQGAVTGRMTHSQPNDGQVAKDHRVRGLYLPRPGWILVGADASGLELRMLANRMAKFDGGAYGRILLEGDIHTENQTAAGLDTRNNAKTFIYGFLYGAGDGKIGKIIGRGVKEGKKLRARFLDKLPALKKVIDAAKFACGKLGHVVLLDGRKAPCRSPHSALNTLLQGDGAVVMKLALIILDKKLQAMGFKPGEDYEFVANVHDEFQIECRRVIAETVGKTAVASITEAGVRLKCRIRMDGEYKIGTTWSETH